MDSGDSGMPSSPTPISKTNRASMGFDELNAEATTRPVRRDSKVQRTIEVEPGSSSGTRWTGRF